MVIVSSESAYIGQLSVMFFLFKNISVILVTFPLPDSKNVVE